MPIRLVLAALVVAVALPVKVLAASPQASPRLRAPTQRSAGTEASVHRLGPVSSAQPLAGPASLVAAPASPVVGAPVTVRVTGAASPATDYRWDLAGQGHYGRDTGASPQVAVRFETPGAHTVGLEMKSGRSARRLSLTINVGAARRTTSSPVRNAVSRSSAPARATRPVSEAPRAHLAGDPGVTIVDFNFSPGTITIHTGDTITWTNTGAQPHTATANDHSFDTGVLKKGQSGSHTFAQTGTFSYICTIHPFMKGTVTVLASNSSGGGSGSGGSSSGGSSSGSGASSATAGGSTGSTSGASSQNLPFTGFNLVAAVLSGLILIASGLALRWWARRPDRRRGGDTTEAATTLNA